jgi:hypothetical protein
MKTIDEKIEEVEKTMLKEYKRGQCNEVTNSKYIELLKEKQKEVSFKGYDLKLK